MILLLALLYGRTENINQTSLSMCLTSLTSRHVTCTRDHSDDVIWAWGMSRRRAKDEGGEKTRKNGNIIIWEMEIRPLLRTCRGKRKKIWLKCILCPGQKQLSTAANTTSNLTKHLQRKHASMQLVAAKDRTKSGAEEKTLPSLIPTTRARLDLQKCANERTPTIRQEDLYKLAGPVLCQDGNWAKENIWELRVCINYCWHLDLPK